MGTLTAKAAQQHDKPLWKPLVYRQTAEPTHFEHGSAFILPVPSAPVTFNVFTSTVKRKPCEKQIPNTNNMNSTSRQRPSLQSHISRYSFKCTCGIVLHGYYHRIKRPCSTCSFCSSPNPPTLKEYHRKITLRVTKWSHVNPYQTREASH